MLLQVLYSDAQRAATRRADPIQPAVPLVRQPGHRDSVWNHSVFSKNRDRLIRHDAVTELFNAAVEMADKRRLLSSEHFSVDGTLIQAWASHKACGAGWIRRGRPPRTGAVSRATAYARIHERPGLEAVPQRAMPRLRLPVTWAMC